MQARFGEGFFSLLQQGKIIYSIRLVPGSSPGQPIRKIEKSLFHFDSLHLEIFLMYLVVNIWSI